MLLVALAQAIAVDRSFGGDWTGLFFTGEEQQLPAHVPATYRHSATRGYDGQFYRLLAYDPLLRRTPPGAFDAPRLRSRRILVPLLARIAALGSDRWTDLGYRIVILAAIGLGVGWTCAFAAAAGLPSAWGLAFLLLPATLVSAERLTVDAALAALCAGFAWAMARERPGWALLFAGLAPLVRETGMVLPAALTLWNLAQARWKPAIVSGAATLPFVAWAAYVETALPADGVGFTSLLPLAGLVRRSLQWHATAGGGFNYEVATALDYLALIGIWIGLALTVRIALGKPREAVRLSRARSPARDRALRRLPAVPDLPRHLGRDVRLRARVLSLAAVARVIERHDAPPDLACSGAVRGAAHPGPTQHAPRLAERRGQTALRPYSRLTGSTSTISAVAAQFSATA